jgi:hypothetical protein
VDYKYHDLKDESVFCRHVIKPEAQVLDSVITLLFEQLDAEYMVEWQLQNLSECIIHQTFSGHKVSVRFSCSFFRPFFLTCCQGEERNYLGTSNVGLISNVTRTQFV